MKCDFANSRRYLVANDLHYGLRKKLWNGDGKSKHLKASSFTQTVSNFWIDTPPFALSPWMPAYTLTSAWVTQIIYNFIRAYFSCCDFWLDWDPSFSFSVRMCEGAANGFYDQDVCHLYTLTGTHTHTHSDTHTWLVRGILQLADNLLWTHQSSSER